METLLTIFKWFFGIALIPAVVATTVIFWQELPNLGDAARLLKLGGFVYIGLHLFFCRLDTVYQTGQKIFTDIFKFNAPLAASAPRVFPIWTGLLLLVYFLLHKVFEIRHFDTYLLFFIGLTFTMHIILTAQELYKEDSIIIKPHYLAAMGLTYISALIVAAGLLDIITGDISVWGFLKSVWREVVEYYSVIFHKMM